MVVIASIFDLYLLPRDPTMEPMINSMILGQDLTSEQGDIFLPVCGTEVRLEDMLTVFSVKIL